jgi:membrane protein insertase Oxa1/YidC/SpoIIIJ
MTNSNSGNDDIRALLIQLAQSQLETNRQIQETQQEIRATQESIRDTNNFEN